MRLWRLARPKTAIWAGCLGRYRRTKAAVQVQRLSGWRPREKLTLYFTSEGFPLAEFPLAQAGQSFVGQAFNWLNGNNLHSEEQSSLFKANQFRF
jgi:hypothetical protein